MGKRFTIALASAFALAFAVSCSSGNQVKVRQYVVSGEPATPQDARNFDVFILATGDVAGDVDRENVSDDVIGAATFSGLVQAVRRYNENTLVLDTGNFLYGTRLASGNGTADLKDGMAMIEIARRAGYNAMNIGRNDFLYGARALSDCISAAQRKAEDKQNEVYFVSQNSRRGGNYVDKFKIFNFNGFKLGVIGLATPDLAIEMRRDISGAFNFEINYDEIQRDINSLNRVVDYVVLLSNLRSSDENVPGLVNIEAVISNLKGIDLVINNNSEAGTASPMMVKDKVEKDVMLVSPGSGFESVGLIQFQIEAGIPVGDPVYTLIKAREIRNPAGSNILTQLNVIRKPFDEDLDVYVKQLQEKVNESEGAPYAYMPYEFLADRQQLGSIQSDIGFIIADAFARASDSDVAIIPSLIIKKGLPSGEISKQDIFRSLPSLDGVIRVSMTGQEIYDVIEYGYGALPAAIGRYPQTNLIIEYNASADEGSRVSSLTMQNGSRIEKNQQSYTVATIDSSVVGLYDYNRHFRDRNRFTVPNSTGRGSKQAWEVFADHLAQQFPVEYSL